MRLVAAGATVAYVATAAPRPGGAADGRSDASASTEGGEGSRAGSWFVDARGEERAFLPTYQAWIGARREPRYGRAAVETLILTALGTAYYFGDPLADAEDRDDPGIGNKLTLQAISLDSNYNSTNALLHPGAGAAVYGFSRINGLSIPAALGYSLAGSLAWEFALELRDQVSINDMIYTVGGGMALGEAMIQLGDYLNSAPDGGGIGNRIAAYTVGLPRALHVLADRERLPAPLPADSLGFSSAYGHAFRLAYELVRNSNDRDDRGTLHRVAIDAEIVTMPGHLRPGVIDKTFSHGNFTEIHARLATGPGGTETEVLADATLAGHYTQRIDADRSGYATMVGIGSAWRFHESRLLARRDQLSAVHLVGPHLGLWLSEGLLRVQVMADGHLDFASLGSLAFETWSVQFGNGGTKTVLSKQGYTYQLGASGRVRTAISVGPLTLRGHVAYGRYSSVDGVDRFQSTVTRDVGHVESVLEAGGSLRARVSIADVGLGVDERWRESTMGSVSVDRRDRFVYFSLGLGF